MLHSSSLWAKDKIGRLQHLPSVLDKDDQEDTQTSHTCPNLTAFFGLTVTNGVIDWLNTYFDKMLLSKTNLTTAIFENIN
jgi:hypothetical protein